jgi:hypothetical protein
VLYNVAQIHRLDVRLGVFRMAVGRFSRLWEMSKDGERARMRWRRDMGWGKEEGRLRGGKEEGDGSGIVR